MRTAAGSEHTIKLKLTPISGMQRKVTIAPTMDTALPMRNTACCPFNSSEKAFWIGVKT